MVTEYELFAMIDGHEALKELIVDYINAINYEFSPDDFEIHSGDLGEIYKSNIDTIEVDYWCDGSTVRKVSIPIVNLHTDINVVIHNMREAQLIRTKQILEEQIKREAELAANIKITEKAEYERLKLIYGDVR